MKKNKGKGNKLMALKKTDMSITDEQLAFAVVIPVGAALIVRAGKQFKTIKAAELEEYRAERAKRGTLLPKGYQNVTSLEIAVN